MLSIFICERNNLERLKLEEIIRNYLMIEEFDMCLKISTNNPLDIINYLKTSPQIRGIYFLDVDLGHSINGFQLGSFIREHDLDGKIIFITSHYELLTFIFTYKIEALDYILKNNPENIQKRIYEALKQAQKHYEFSAITETKLIKLKIDNQIRIFPLENILFIETSPIPHKLILHLTDKTLNFYGKISTMTEHSPMLVRTHKSYVVNLLNIQSIDSTNRQIIMNNGEICYVSIRQLKRLEQAQNQQL